MACNIVRKPINMQLTISVNERKLWVRQGNFGTSRTIRSFAIIRIQKKRFGVSNDTFKGIPKNRGWCIQDTVEL